MRFLCDPTTKASAHVIIGRDSSVVQLVEFNTIAWHAGASRRDDRIGLNAYSIGIEIDNAGRLTQTASGDFVTWFGQKIAKSDAVLVVHRIEPTATWWHAYTQAKIEKVFERKNSAFAGRACRRTRQWRFTDSKKSPRWID